MMVKEFISQNGGENKKFRLFHNRQNYLLGGSTILAFKMAIDLKMDYLICMHGDGQADPATLEPLIAASDQKNDLVFGSRFLPLSDLSDYSRARTLGNRLINKLEQILIGRKIHDIGGFISFKLSTVQEVPYFKLPSDMGYHPLLVILICMQKTHVHFVEVPMKWGRVVSSNVRLVPYTLRHIWRMFLFAVGRPPFVGPHANPFLTDEL